MGPLPALAVAPLAALTAGAAVVSIISGVAGYISDSKRLKLLNEINGKLDAVIRNQVNILNEIKSLRVYIDQALVGAFREAAIVKMNAHQDRFEVLIVEHPSSKNRDDYINLQTDVEQTAFELGQYDTPAYIAFGAGVGMTLAIHQVLNLGQSRLEKLREVFKRPYDRWLDPANPLGIVAIITATQSEIDRRKKALEARPRSLVISESHDYRCTNTTTLIISGDFNSGYKGQTSTSRQCVPDPCERTTGRMCPKWHEVEHEFTKRLGTTLGLTIPASADRRIEIPVFAPSGYGPVDDMNRERIAIYELMTILVSQNMIKQQMEECAKALSTPI
jgi:hypothetical protein